MPATPTQARDQMSALFKTALDAANLNPALVVFWEDVGAAVSPPPPPAPWARFAVKHAAGGQAALAGDNQKRRFTYSGLVSIQLFTVSLQGQVPKDQIVAIILAAYEGKTTSGGIFFRNARFNDIGTSGEWYQTNILVEFEYDNIHA